VPTAFSESYDRDARLVGAWRNVENSVLVTEITFRQDGSFFSKIVKNGEVYGEIEGKWLTRGNFLYYLYNKVSPPRVPVGTRDKDTIVEITKDYFIVYSVNQRTRKYVKDELNSLTK